MLGPIFGHLHMGGRSYLRWEADATVGGRVQPLPSTGMLELAPPVAQPANGLHVEIRAEWSVQPGSTCGHARARLNGRGTRAIDVLGR